MARSILSWEKNIPLMHENYHLAMLEKAYGDPSVKVYPPQRQAFKALELVPFDDVKVVIIGQDPYFNEKEQGIEAHGLSFSVCDGVPIPPSLRNIFNEINNSVYGGRRESCHSDLTRWAEQGVLLLNASLTVIAGQANSHAGIGWHKLTDDIIANLSSKRTGIVFMLWGAFAQKKLKLIDEKKHCVLCTSHPSPLSSYRGFTGSGVFVKCNDYLVKNNQDTITW